METSSEAHRRACEVRYAARLPDDNRKAFYLDVRKHRGEDAARALIAEVNAERRRVLAKVCHERDQPDEDRHGAAQRSVP